MATLRDAFQAFALVLLLGASAARAQTLVHAYAFNGTLNDAVGSVTLTNTYGGSLTSNPGYYTFGAAQGLGFVGEVGLQSQYTIAMRFSFETVTGYRRIINFEYASHLDSGQYVLSGAFNFYPGRGTGGSITGNTSVDFILTRNSSGLVSAYQGTTPIFSFQDTSNYAVASSVSNQSRFTFFRDDGGENSAGRIDSLVIYNGALNSAQIASGMVANDLTAIPEPTTMAVWSGAAGLAVALAWRRRRRPAV